MKTGHTKWYLYVFVIAFAVYWASNLVLWFPWSIDSRLGIALMLTFNPVLWGWAAYSCLVRFPHKNLMKSSLNISIILLFTAVMLDYLFFGLIRNATDELYHPTTFYGYGFVLILPFIISFIFRRRIMQKQKSVTKKDYFRPAIIGVVCLFLLSVIIVFEINL